jgi:hypothetical protein
MKALAVIAVVNVDLFKLHKVSSQKKLGPKGNTTSIVEVRVRDSGAVYF